MLNAATLTSCLTPDILFTHNALEQHSVGSAVLYSSLLID